VSRRSDHADLYDANVLIALRDVGHTHHDRVAMWHSTSAHRYATCPISQGALVRYLVRAGAADVVVTILNELSSDPRQVFWPDDLPFERVDLGRVVGHRQVTDAYLAGLARDRTAKLITLDAALVTLHPDVAALVPE